MTELLTALPYIAAFLLAFALPLGGLVQYRLGGMVSPETRLILLLLLMALGAILSVGFATRNLDESQLIATSAQEAYEDASGGFAASRLFSVFVVGAGFIEIVRGWLVANASQTPDPARPVLFAVLGLYVGTQLIQGIVSDVPSFSYKNFYPLIALLAVYYQRIEDLPRVVGAVKLAIVVLTVGSLAVVAVEPDFVLQRPAASVLPGIDFRMFGLTSHANTIGPVALLGIVLELAYPSRFFVLRWAQLIAGAIVFVLAQSKTAWVAAALMIPLVLLPLAMARSADAGKRRNDFNRSVLALLVVIGLITAMVLGLAQFDVVDFLQRKVAGIETLAGRTVIWKLTLDAWRDNVLFGYGADIWGYERRMQFRLPFVGMAHNQFIQTLGEAGLVGLILLLTYLGVLLRAALKWFMPSRGVILAILLLILARCMTEAPMRAVELLSWPLFTHLVLLTMVCHYMRRSVAAPVVAAAPTPPVGLAARRLALTPKSRMLIK